MSSLDAQLDVIVDGAADPHDVDQAVARFLLSLLRSATTTSTNTTTCGQEILAVADQEPTNH